MLSHCTCLHLSFTPLLLVRDELSVENSLSPSTLMKPLSISKRSISLPLSQRFSRESRFGLVNLSSRVGTASNFAISTHIARHVAGCLAKMMYSSRIISLFFQDKFMFVKPAFYWLYPRHSCIIERI